MPSMTLPILHRAACWAAAILLLAVANRLGWIADEAAQTLYFTLPVLAVITLGSTRRGDACCHQHRSA